MPISPISIVSNGRPASQELGRRLKISGAAWHGARAWTSMAMGQEAPSTRDAGQGHGGVAGCSDTSACELGQWLLERGWYSSASFGFACVWYLGHDFLWGGGRAGVWWHRIKSNFWPGAEAPGGENGALWISGGGIANGTKSLSFYVRKSNFRSGGRPP